ncbi:Anthranilate phosphoribosyltransferase [uncultured archaeon]|nr:Anthranilate phosphoribosyltransferase [uncultured archaeon]
MKKRKTRQTKGKNRAKKESKPKAARKKHALKKTSKPTRKTNSTQKRRGRPPKSVARRVGSVDRGVRRVGRPRKVEVVGLLGVRRRGRPRKVVAQDVSSVGGVVLPDVSSGSQVVPSSDVLPVKVHSHVLKPYLERLSRRYDLTYAEAQAAMAQIMSGRASDAEIAGYLMALSVKGPTPEEIAASASFMRDNAVSVKPVVNDVLVDVCGTGGDNAGTFNISTTSMFIAAAAGVPIAKHGNRGVSSRSGSADVLEALGVPIDMPPEQVEDSIRYVGLGFIFAPAYHTAMKHVMPARKSLGVKTLFNILGPLSNPAGAQAHVIGVYEPQLLRPVSEVLKMLHVQRAFVVYGEPGLDEFSTCGETKVADLAEGVIRTYSIQPDGFGLKRANIQDLAGGNPQENAQILRGILSGEDTGVRRDVVLLNAAAAIVAGGKAKYLADGVTKARNVLSDGKALEKLNEYIEFNKRFKSAKASR